ncbi:MAG TPA: lysoplasmalogenase [Spirochaetota bacterium]|nr:lysoplasmalogenase [Spirochaetota bacterium]
MEVYSAIIAVLAVVVVFLIRAEFANNRQAIYRFKPVASSVLVVILLYSLFRTGCYRADVTFTLLSGLLLCFGGDMALMFQSPRAFRIGLVLFLLGHVVYAVALTVFNGFHAIDLISGGILLLLGIGIYRFLYPGLEAMKIPVLFYIIIISFMVNRAVSLFSGNVFSVNQAVILTTGASLFYISDVILAVARFRVPWKYNRISLAFYYSGQALIAVSAGFFC